MDADYGEEGERGMREFAGKWKGGASAAMAGMLLCAPSALAYGRSGERDHVFIDVSGLPIIDNTLNGNDFGGGGSAQYPASQQNNNGFEATATAGFLLWSHFLVGATYDSSYLNNLYSSPVAGSSGISGQTLTYRTQEWGPTLGVVFGGFYVDGTYFISGSKQTSFLQTSPTNGSILGDQWYNNTGVRGYLLSIGYSFEVVRHIYVGPKLAYRNISYSTQGMTDYVTSSNSYGATKLATRDQDSELEPMLSLQFRF